MARAAVAAGADGIIVEVVPNPTSQSMDHKSVPEQSRTARGSACLHCCVIDWNIYNSPFAELSEKLRHSIAKCRKDASDVESTANRDGSDRNGGEVRLPTSAIYHPAITIFAFFLVTVLQSPADKAIDAAVKAYANNRTARLRSSRPSPTR